MFYESSFIDFIKKFKIPGCGVDQRFTRTKYNDKTTDYCHSLKDIYKLSCKFSGILWDGFRVKGTEDIKYYCTVSVFLFTAGNLAQTLNGVPRVFQNHSVTVSFTWHKASMQADNFSINIECLAQLNEWDREICFQKAVPILIHSVSMTTDGINIPNTELCCHNKTTKAK